MIGETKEEGRVRRNSSTLEMPVHGLENSNGSVHIKLKHSREWLKIDMGIIENYGAVLINDLGMFKSEVCLVRIITT